MQSTRKKRTRQPVANPPSSGGWRARFAGKKEVFWFCGKFSLLMLVYFAVSLTPFFQSAMNGYLTGIARLSSILLNAIGETSQVAGATISSSKYSINILPFCAATEFMAFFCAAAIAFPARWIQRVAGMLAGIAAIMGLNLLRVVSLFYVGVHFRGSFDVIHEEIWPAVFILATISMISIWIKWVSGDKGEQAHG